MYSMKDVCEKTGIAYETLKYYCNEGLLPHVKRDTNHYRVFHDKDVDWVRGLLSLRQCGMSLKEMREFVNLNANECDVSAERQRLLNLKQEEMLRRIEDIKLAMKFITDNKCFDVEDTDK